jgi:hypothetical protein
MTDISLPAAYDNADFRLTPEKVSEIGGFRVGRVIDRTAGVLSRSFLPLFLVTAVAQLPTQLVSHIWNSPASGHPPSSAHLIAASAGLWALSILRGIISQGTILYRTFADLRETTVSVGGALQVALRRFRSFFALSLIMTILQGVAILGLIFPAFMLMAMWFVATPACVIEDRGPFVSMGRSRLLTKGYRWRIFGLFLALFAALLVGSAALAASLNVIGGSALKLVGSVAWSAVWSAVFTIAVAVTYHDLRAIRKEFDGSGRAH